MATFNLVTIEREYGSGAALVAQKLAARLGWKLWDQFLTDEIARYLECDPQRVQEHEERGDSLHYRLFKSFMRGSFEGSPQTPHMKIADAEGIRPLVESLVKRAAEEGHAVIVGRGAAYYLHGRADAFHVFLYAPYEDKVRRLEQEGKSHKEAQDLVQHVDQERTAFIKQQFGIDWPVRHMFHLMVNTIAGEEAAAETIINALSAVQKHA